jgi:hypothetical protein
MNKTASKPVRIYPATHEKAVKEATEFEKKFGAKKTIAQIIHEWSLKS